MENVPTARVLVVEDETLLRGLIVQFLRGEGFDVLEAADGLIAVEVFTAERPFDLILLDLNLPGLPGVDVCRRIRQLEPAQPVMICSAAILDAHVEALTALGVHQFLTKPYHPEELLRRIRVEIAGRAQAGRPQRPAAAVLRDEAHGEPQPPRRPRSGTHVLSKGGTID